MLETCLSVNEQPIGALLMSLQDLSSENHCEEEQTGRCYPVRGYPDWDEDKFEQIKGGM